jgi:hypothetical protein
LILIILTSYWACPYNGFLGQLPGSFFHSLKRSIPWFISIGNPVNGVENACLMQLLGFNHEVGVDFLCSIGLLRHGHSQSTSSITVVNSSWDKFIEEEQLGDIMETITKRCNA